MKAMNFMATSSPEATWTDVCTEKIGICDKQEGKKKKKKKPMQMFHL